MSKPSWFNKIFCFWLLLFLPCTAFSGVVNDEAVTYRNYGYEAQKKGDYNRALMFYQKALSINPAYVNIYNDLGVLYETSDKKDKALEMYRRALKIDPGYPEVYFNLASLYEREGDFLKAAYYWKKRIQLGEPGSSGTLKAKEHLRQIGQVYPDIGEELKSIETDELLSDMVSVSRGTTRYGELSDSKKGNEGYIISHDHPVYQSGFFTEDDKHALDRERDKEVKKLVLQMSDSDTKNTLLLSQDRQRKIDEYLASGKAAYEAGNYAEAITKFNDVTYLDPDNKEAQELLENSRKKVLLK